MSDKSTLIFFITKDGLRLAAETWGLEKQQPVLLLHGGGQNRNSWGDAANAIAAPPAAELANPAAVGKLLFELTFALVLMFARFLTLFKLFTILCTKNLK